MHTIQQKSTTFIGKCLSITAVFICKYWWQNVSVSRTQHAI